MGAVPAEIFRQPGQIPAEGPQWGRQRGQGGQEGGNRDNRDTRDNRDGKGPPRRRGREGRGRMGQGARGDEWGTSLGLMRKGR